jgi:hypothetical protein
VCLRAFTLVEVLIVIGRDRGLLIAAIGLGRREGDTTHQKVNFTLSDHAQRAAGDRPVRER